MGKKTFRESPQENWVMTQMYKKSQSSIPRFREQYFLVNEMRSA
jgi:hypothetical protein